jgi:hypothetical protein
MIVFSITIFHNKIAILTFTNPFEFDTCFIIDNMFNINTDYKSIRCSICDKPLLANFDTNNGFYEYGELPDVKLIHENATRVDTVMPYKTIIILEDCNTPGRNGLDIYLYMSYCSKECMDHADNKRLIRVIMNGFFTKILIADKKYYEDIINNKQNVYNSDLISSVVDLLDVFNMEIVEKKNINDCESVESASTNSHSLPVYNYSECTMI